MLQLLSEIVFVVLFFTEELLPWRMLAARSSQKTGKLPCMNRAIFWASVQADGNNSFYFDSNVVVYHYMLALGVIAVSNTLFSSKPLFYRNIFI